MFVLGILPGRTGSASISRNGKILFSACEKDFCKASDNPLPLNSIDHCIKMADISMHSLHSVIIAGKPYRDFYHFLKEEIYYSPFRFRKFFVHLKDFLGVYLDIENILREYTGDKVKFYFSENIWNLAFYFFSLKKEISTLKITLDGQICFFEKKDGKIKMTGNGETENTYSNGFYQADISDLYGHEFSEGACMLCSSLHGFETENIKRIPVIYNPDKYKEIYLENHGIHYSEIDNVNEMMCRMIEEKMDFVFFSDSPEDSIYNDLRLYHKGKEVIKHDIPANFYSLMTYLNNNRATKALINRYFLDTSSE